MSEPYLIAHKVRGQPAFDVAEQMECPNCNGKGEYDKDEFGTFDCHECDSLGYWWIVSTSGHRAYPVDAIPLNELIHSPSEAKVLGSVLDYPRPTMDEVPNHYGHHTAPTISLTDRLGLKPSPQPKIKRRI